MSLLCVKSNIWKVLTFFFASWHPISSSVIFFRVLSALFWVDAEARNRQIQTPFKVNYLLTSSRCVCRSKFIHPKSDLLRNKAPTLTVRRDSVSRNSISSTINVDFSMREASLIIKNLLSHRGSIHCLAVVVSLTPLSQVLQSIKQLVAKILKST